jgi:DNA-binding response OmpR family regulator
MEQIFAAARILVADDDPELLALTSFAIRNAGFDVSTVEDGARAIEMLEAQSFSLAVIDVNMPGADGFEVCARVRERSRMPVIMLSARSADADIVRALDLGADDYVTKPFSPRTLIARMRALLRRTVVEPQTTLRAGDALLDTAGLRLEVRGVRYDLTPLEAAVLRLLMARPGRFVSTELLTASVWNRNGAEERNALKQVVYRLRRKLERDPSVSSLLETARHVGYRWIATDVSGEHA